MFVFVWALVAWWLSAPQTLSETEVAAFADGSAARGETMFWAGGCASCHAAPKAKGEDKLRLGGGLRLVTPFGDFIAPNISPHETDGIGSWTSADFANAMVKGTSPSGGNYYPAFPYTSYARMTPRDVAGLFAFMQTLEPVARKAPGHELGFPFNIRRAVGLWKLLYLNPVDIVAAPAEAADVDLAQWQRGRYLVEGPGHCGECHTPRSVTGGLDLESWLAGAPAAAGDGTVPHLTPEAGSDFASWSVGDIAYYLESGFTPDYDSVGGEMVAVQENMAKLSTEDREAIGLYLKHLPVAGSEGS